LVLCAREYPTSLEKLREQHAHHFSGKNACGWTMEDVARDIVPRVAAVRDKFPAVQIGDIEPVGTAQPPDWVEEISQWTQVYRKVVGEPLSFFHADVAWNGPWQQQLSAVKSRINAAGRIASATNTDQRHFDRMTFDDAQDSRRRT
jgi:hypothetical protein